MPDFKCKVKLWNREKEIYRHFSDEDTAYYWLTLEGYEIIDIKEVILGKVLKKISAKQARALTEECNYKKETSEIDWIMRKIYFAALKNSYYFMTTNRLSDKTCKTLINLGYRVEDCISYHIIKWIDIN